MSHTKAALKALKASIPDEKWSDKIGRLAFGLLFIASAIWLAHAGIKILLSGTGQGIWLVAGAGALLVYGGHIISKDFSEAAKAFVLGIFKDIWATVRPPRE